MQNMFLHKQQEEINSIQKELAQRLNIYAIFQCIT